MAGPEHILSANDSKQDNHNGDYQKNMNQAAHGVGSEKSRELQNKQNDCNSVEHCKFPFSDIGVVVTSLISNGSPAKETSLHCHGRRRMTLRRNSSGFQRFEHERHSKDDKEQRDKQ